MEVFTVQMAAWKAANAHGALVIDITARVGGIFSPSWSMDQGHRSGSISDAEYKQEYVQRLSQRVRENPVPWQEFMMYHADSRIALACFCTPGLFCHRHLLAPMLGQLSRHWNIPYTFYGEIVK
jgi:hypothetical protein